MNNVTEKQIEIENSLGEKLFVPKRLKNPNEFIKEAKKNMESSKDSRNLFDGFIDYRRGISFRVQPAGMSRALRFMDTLIKALLALGHSVRYDSAKNHLFFKIKEEEFEIVFREKSKRIEVESKYSWNRFKKVPTGIFLLQATGWLRGESVWQDGKMPIEKQLSKILAELELKSQRIVEERREWKLRQELRNEEIRKEKDQEISVENELRSFEKLVEDAELWRTAVKLREYITEGLLNSKVHSKEYVEWARVKADWIDPTYDLQDRILSEKDKKLVLGY